MTIKFYRKNVYGKNMEYVAEAEQAVAITMITGKVCLDARIKTGLEHLGFKFEEVLESAATAITANK
jgi:hypothetical protein